MVALLAYTQETGVDKDILSKLDYHQFWIAYGAKRRKYLRLVDIFCKGNALQMNR
jgi:hypothetical protein